MEIFETLSKEEISAINDYIYLYGARSNCVQSVASIDHILRFWEEAKGNYLYKIFGEKLILNKTITFEKDESEIADRIRSELTGPYGPPTIYKDFLRAWHNLGIQLSEEKDDNNISWCMQELVSGSTLASNRYSYDTIEIPLPQEKKYRLAPGAKASKAIGKIAMAYNLPCYEEFRIAHSQILNEKSVSGNLCLSIHPLDYMTMSDNDCGWSSCMSWADHGDFRQGTVEMMNSPMVVMAYLKSTTDYALNARDAVYWNSKRWRELFIITPETIVGIKGYPYWNENLEKEAMVWIRELVEKSGLEGFGPYDHEFYTYSGGRNEIQFEDECIPLSFETGLMYNDLYDTHKILVCEDHSRIPGHIYYSGITECLSCGERMIDWETEADLFCSACDPVYRCSECGDWHTYDDLIEVDGVLYCEYCYDNYILRCSSCGDEHHYEDMVTVHLATDSEHISVEKEIYLDERCIYQELCFKEEDLHRAYKRWGNRVNYVYAEDLTEWGLKCFGFDSLEEALAYESTDVYTDIED